MKRFSILFVLGALLLLGGQVWLSVSLHPDSHAALGRMLLSLGAVTCGTAVIGMAMVGMVGSYAGLATRTNELLVAKTPPQQDPLAEAARITTHNRRFWRAYALTSLGICVFLSGLLGVTIALGRSTYVLYLIGLSGGVAVLGIAVLLLETHALKGVHRAHRALRQSLEVLSLLPDIPPTSPAPPPPSQPRWVRSRAQRERRPRGGRPRPTPAYPASVSHR